MDERGPEGSGEAVAQRPNLEALAATLEKRASELERARRALAQAQRVEELTANGYRQARVAFAERLAEIEGVVADGGA